MRAMGHDLVVAPGLEDGLLVRRQENQRIRCAVVARRHVWLELVRPLHLSQGGGQGSEPLAPVLASVAGAGGALSAMKAKRGVDGERVDRRESSDAPLPSAPNVGYRVPAKPLRFELWGAHEDLPPTDPRPKASP